MAELAYTIHSTEVEPEDGFQVGEERVGEYIEGGIGREDRALGDKCMALLNALPRTDTLLHGDFHTGNVFLQRGEPLLIDMDRLATGHPILELSDLYYFYVLLGEDDPGMVERFMGFSYETAKAFFRFFLKHYLKTEDEARLNEVTEKASLMKSSKSSLMISPAGFTSTGVCGFTFRMRLLSRNMVGSAQQEGVYNDIV